MMASYNEYLESELFMQKRIEVYKQKIITKNNRYYPVAAFEASISLVFSVLRKKNLRESAAFKDFMQFLNDEIGKTEEELSLRNLHLSADYIHRIIDYKEAFEEAFSSWNTEVYSKIRPYCMVLAENDRPESIPRSTCSDTELNCGKLHNLSDQKVSYLLHKYF